MNGEIKNKLQRGLALTVKESWDLYKYIEALEQQPCDDCVSREKVIELIADENLSMGQVVKGIHALPPVTPKVESEDESERNRDSN